MEIRGFWGVQAGLNSIGSSLGVESIAEFSTLTSSFSAQYNNASVLNEVTRSGANEFHGSAYGFFRNSAMDARSFFQPLSGPPAFHRDQFGGALGGPIQEDKTGRPWSWCPRGGERCADRRPAARPEDSTVA